MVYLIHVCFAWNPCMSKHADGWLENMWWINHIDTNKFHFKIMWPKIRLFISLAAPSRDVAVSGVNMKKWISDNYFLKESCLCIHHLCKEQHHFKAKQITLMDFSCSKTVTFNPKKQTTLCIVHNEHLSCYSIHLIPQWLHLQSNPKRKFPP